MAQPFKSAAFRDPVHGFVDVYEPEERIIDTPAFQRLRRIRQLAFTNYVYHGAEHTRFPHSIGVMHSAARILDSVRHNRPEALPADEWERSIYLLRLYALLHDLGHGPFSHASDEFFEQGVKHEDAGAMLIENTEIAQIIDQSYGELGIKAKDIADLLRKTKGNRTAFLLQQIMDSDADADKMDYLLRDSLHCGVAYGRFDLDRMVHSYTVYEDQDANSWRLAIKKGGLFAFESFVLARYWMFIQVYFHAKRRFWDIALQRFVEHHDLHLTSPSNPKQAERFLCYDDGWLWRKLVAADHCDDEWAHSIVHRSSWPHRDMTVGAHVPDQVMQGLGYLKRNIEGRFGKDRVLFDRPEKSPHNLKDLQTRAQDEESMSIVLLDTDGTQVGIMEVSEVAGTLRDKIRIPRFYARPTDLAEVEAEWDSFKTKGDDGW